MGYITEAELDPVKTPAPYAGRIISEADLDPAEGARSPVGGRYITEADLDPEPLAATSEAAFAPTLDTVSIPEYEDVKDLQSWTGPMPEKEKPLPIIASTPETRAREEQLFKQGYSADQVASIITSNTLGDLRRKIGDAERRIKEISAEIESTTDPYRSMKLREEGLSLIDAYKRNIDRYNEMVSGLKNKEEKRPLYETEYESPWTEVLGKALQNFPVRAAQGIAGVAGAVEELSPNRELFEKYGTGSLGRAAAKTWGVIAEENKPTIQPGTPKAWVSSAVESTALNLPLLLAGALAGGNIAVPLVGMGLIAGGQKYSDIREKRPDIAVPLAVAVAGGAGTMEGLSELIPVKTLFNKNIGFIKKFFNELVQETSTEMANTVYSDLQDKMTIRPNMTWGEFLQDEIDTLMSSAIAVPMLVGATHPAIKYLERKQQEAVAADEERVRKFVQEAKDRYEKQMAPLRKQFSVMTEDTFRKALNKRLQDINYDENGIDRRNSGWMKSDLRSDQERQEAALIENALASDTIDQQVGDVYGILIEKPAAKKTPEARPTETAAPSAREGAVPEVSAAAIPPEPLDPELARWILAHEGENIYDDILGSARETLGMPQEPAAPPPPKHTDDLNAVRQDMKAGRAAPEDVIETYAAKLDDLSGLMQEKEANTLEARRGKYEIPGQTALDFGPKRPPLPSPMPTSPAPEKTQPVPTSEAEEGLTAKVALEEIPGAVRTDKAKEIPILPSEVGEWPAQERQVPPEKGEIIPVSTKEVHDEINKNIRRVLEELAPQLGVNIRSITFSGEKISIDPSTPEGVELARKYGLSDEEIEDARRNNEIFTVGAEHRSIVPDTPEGQKRSDIILHYYATPADVFHEFAHAADRQGKVALTGTPEERARQLEKWLVEGRELSGLSGKFYEARDGSTLLADSIDYSVRIFSEEKEVDYPAISKAILEGEPVTQSMLTGWVSAAKKAGVSPGGIKKALKKFSTYNKLRKEGRYAILPLPEPESAIYREGPLNTAAVEGFRRERLDNILYPEAQRGARIVDLGALYEGGEGRTIIPKKARGLRADVLLNLPITFGRLQKPRPANLNYPLIVTGNPHLEDFRRPHRSWDDLIKVVRVKPVLHGNDKVVDAVVRAINYAKEIGAHVLATSFRAKQPWALAKYTNFLPTDPNQPGFYDYWKINPKPRPTDLRRIDWMPYIPKNDKVHAAFRAHGWDIEKNIYGKGGTWWWPRSRELDPKIKEAIGDTEIEYCDLLHKGCPSCRNCQKLTYPGSVASPIFGVTDEPFCEHGCPQCFVRLGQSGIKGRKRVSIEQNAKQMGFGEGDLGEKYRESINILQKVVRPAGSGKVDYVSSFLDKSPLDKIDMVASLYIDGSISDKELRIMQSEIADDTNGATLQVASAEDVVDYSVRRRRAEGESQATAKARSLLGGTINEPEKTYRDEAEIAAQAVSELESPALLQSVEAVPGAGVRARGRTAGGEPVRVPVQEAGRAEAAPRRAVTLGKTVSDLKELKSVSLRGVEVPTWNAVYSALRIVRNANVEVLHVLYRGRTSEKILYNEAYSCRLPGSVENVNPYLLAMNAVGEAQKLSRLHNEEVEIILAHNHPSGDITTSASDQRFTKVVADSIAKSRGNFAGHIVIDHNKYSLIDAAGYAESFVLPDVPAEYRNDPLLTVPVPHQALGENVTMPDHIALIAKDINRGEHYFTVLLRSGKKIRGIVNVPLDILDDLKAATEFIHELAVQHGAQDVFAYREEFTSRQRSILGQMIYQNTLRDAVENTSGFAQDILPNTGLLFGKERTAYEAQKLEGAPQEIKGKGEAPVNEHALLEKETPYGEEEDDSFDFGANIEKEIEANPEKHISLDFKDHLDGYIAGLYDMVASGEPGKRLALEGINGADDVIGWGSTYPEFMKGQGWSAKEVLAALKSAQKGEKMTEKQKEIVRAAIHQAADMFFADMERWMPNLSEEDWKKMESSVEPAIDALLDRYYREKSERAAEREKIARATKITKSRYAWAKEKERAKAAARIKGFKSRQAEIDNLKAQLEKAQAKLRAQIERLNKIFKSTKDKEKAWKEAERIHNTETKKLAAEIGRLKERLAKAQAAAASSPPKPKRLSLKGQIRIVTGQVLADDEITLREMDALKAQIRMEAAAAKDAFRAGNKEGLAKARAKYQALLDIQRIRRQQRADIRKMIAQMKAVAAKAGKLPPEYKQAINDLLEPWNLARLTEKNRVRLQAIREEIETNENADFPPAVLETLKRLDKRLIRDLSYDEIKAIHQAVMHYAALGRNKLKGMAAQEKIVREMVRGTVIGEMKGAEAEPDRIDIRYSREKKFRGFLQKARNQFGIHLISWEALVESVSGPRSMFYRVIYRQVKEGSLEADRITFELEDEFLQMQDEFQKKEGIKDIAKWLDADREIEYAPGKTIVMSRNQLLSLYHGWRDDDWRRAASEGGFGLWNTPLPNDPNRVYKLGEDGLANIIDAMTPQELAYCELSIPIIQKTGDMLAAKFLEINGYEMPRVESGVYWRKDVMASERGKADETTELQKARFHRPGIFKGMTIQRTGSTAAVWLKPFTVAMRELTKRAADYVALEEPMSMAAWVMYDKTFRKEFDRRYGMPLWKEIEQGLKDISEIYQPVRDTTWERVGAWLRNKTTLYALGLNYVTMLKQFNGAINYLIYVDPFHLAKAVAQYGTNRSQIRQLHRQMSAEYRHRREAGYSQDVSNVISGLTATGQRPGLITRIGVLGMRATQAIDIFGVDLGMLAAVEQAMDAFREGKLNEDMKDALDMTDEDIKNMTYPEQLKAAYKWADYCTERTQSMSRPEHMSGWQRGSELSKQFSMFMGETQKNLSGLFRAYSKVKRGDLGAKMHLIKVILLYLVVSSYIIDAGGNAIRDILRGRRPDEWWATALKGLTSPIPIVRDITQAVTDQAQGKGFWASGGDTPIARVQETIVKAAVKGTKAMTAKTPKERREAAEDTLDALFNIAGLTLGIPYPALKEPFRIAKREETARKERSKGK